MSRNFELFFSTSSNLNRKRFFSSSTGKQFRVGIENRPDLVPKNSSNSSENAFGIFKLSAGVMPKLIKDRLVNDLIRKFRNHRIKFKYLNKYKTFK